jgi:ubiquinone/menaquinone biosynthesis C-methylase UbiE
MNDSTQFYNSSASWYDLFDLIFLLGRKGHPRQRLVDTLSPDCIRLLDICVGTAATSILVAQHNPQLQIIGIDLSEGMLAVAQKKIRNAKLKNLLVQKMDAS